MSELFSESRKENASEYIEMLPNISINNIFATTCT